MSRKQPEITSYDVVVIGGGASGMMAAGRAAMRGRRVLLIEKNSVLGKKLAITGGGRCNITNAEFDIHQLLSHYGDAQPFLYSTFAQFGVTETFNFFTERGLPLVIQEKQRVFPQTERAPDVVKVLERFLKLGSVTIWHNVTVKGLLFDSKSITGIETTRGVVFAHSYILATGGRSRPETGSTGEGIGWVESIGHTIHQANPDLVPLLAAEPWVKDLAGRSLERAKIAFGEGVGKFKLIGPVLFTHNGLSGPTILNAARRVKDLLKTGPVKTTIDFFPDLDDGTLRTHVVTLFDTHKNQSLRNVLSTFIPTAVAEIVLTLAGSDPRQKVHNMTRVERERLVTLLKKLPLTITGTLGFERAVVSDGGTDLREVDTKTMASRRYPNLFFTGDVLHISRPSGGYSLQLCWSTGWVAGSHA